MKYLKFGCLGLIGAVVLFLVGAFIYEQFIMSDAEKAEIKRSDDAWFIKQRDSLRTMTDTISRRLNRANRTMQALRLDSIPFRCDACDTTMKRLALRAQRTSKDQLSQFTSGGFKPKEPPFGLWLTKDLQQVEGFLQLKDTLTSTYSMTDYLKASKEILSREYLAVYVPVTYATPKISDDKKFFDSGYYYGWMVLIKAATGQVIGYTLFQATNYLQKVESEQLKVGIGPLKVPVVGEGLQEKLDEDFRKQFYYQSELAIRYITRQ